jgi:uncharacterized surface protein with fasciclin (FAS1) repeats
VTYPTPIGAHDAKPRDIVGTLTQTWRFRTFVTILVATELVDDLRAPGPFDVFAPSEKAFDALSPPSLARLFCPHNIEALIDFAEACVGVRDGLALREPVLTEPQVCTNGLIHVVDHLVFPPGLVRACRRCGIVHERTELADDP